MKIWVIAVGLLVGCLALAAGGIWHVFLREKDGALRDCYHDPIPVVYVAPEYSLLDTQVINADNASRLSVVKTVPAGIDADKYFATEISRDKRYIIFNSFGFVKVINLFNQEVEILTNVEEDNSILEVAFTRDNELLIFFEDNLMNFTRGEVLATVLPERNARESNLDINAAGNCIIFGGRDWKLHLLTEGESEKSWRLPALPARVLFSSDGRLLVYSTFGDDDSSGPALVSIQDLKTGDEIVELKRGLVVNIEFTDDNRLLGLVSRQNGVEVYDIESQTFLFDAISIPQDVRVTDIAFSPESNLLAIAVDDGTIQIHDLPSGTLNATLQSAEGFKAVTFTHDMKYLITVDEAANIQYWGAQ